MKLKELYNILNEKYPTSLSCEWDNDGIMCTSNFDAEVKRVLVALDVTMDTVKYATENSFDTIISHHPLVFRGQKALTPKSFTQNKLISLIKNNINVLSFHTRLDAVYGGVNDVLSSLVGLESVFVDPKDPIGRVGFLKEKLPIKEFALKVKDILKSNLVLYSGNLDVFKVYVVGGDGKDLIDNAISAGCDTILTGRASYNTAIDAKDMGLNIIEAGHFFTEHPVCEAIANEIRELSSECEVAVYNSNQINVI